MSPDEDDLIAIPGHQLDGARKGKGRAADRLAPPPTAASRSASPGLSAGGPGVSGKIGSSGQRSSRTQIGGIALETRYTGENTLEESVGESLVSCAKLRGQGQAAADATQCFLCSSVICGQYTIRCCKSSVQAKSTLLCVIGIYGDLYFSQSPSQFCYRSTLPQLSPSPSLPAYLSSSA